MFTCPFNTHRRRHHSEINGGKNSNTVPHPRKPHHSHQIKQSNSHGNLVEKTYYISETEFNTKENRNLVKRTKSFWRFGKNNSDSEILEGMALWRHRDLVDVDDEQTKNQRKFNSQQRIRRDNSTDSDRTINGKQNGGRITNGNELTHQPSFNEDKKKIIRRESQKMPQQNVRKERKKPKHPKNDENEEVNENYGRRKMEDQFYDDDGDGLMMKTVNRKNILQQYDTSGTDSESESDLTSDPYDCIVVDDQKVNKNEHQFPNVAELGKKLEKLSKSNKYSPNKEKNINNKVQEKNKINNRRRRSDSPTENNIKNTQNHMKTFGKGTNNNEQEIIDSEKYYTSQNYDKHNGYHGNNKQRHGKERRNRSSYESIELENFVLKPNNKSMQYDSANDELSEIENRQQFLPRTKLTKTNSNNSKYDQQDISLTDYGETLQKRLKNTAEFAVKYDDKAGRNGNMYGPWYDLWGLDASVKNK